MVPTSYTEDLLLYAEIPKGEPRSTWEAIVAWITKDIPLESILDLQRIWPIEETRQGKTWSRRGKRKTLSSKFGGQLMRL